MAVQISIACVICVVNILLLKQHRIYEHGTFRTHGYWYISIGCVNILIGEDILVKISFMETLLRVYCMHYIHTGCEIAQQ